MEPIELTMRVRPDERSVRLGRRFLGHALLLFGCDDLEPTAALLLSELLGNAVRYARNEVLLSIRATASGVRVEVTDDGPGAPELAAEGSGARGRGLRIVDQLAHTWDVEQRGGAKTVWFELHAGAEVGGQLPSRN